MSQSVQIGILKLRGEGFEIEKFQPAKLDKKAGQSGARRGDDDAPGAVRIAADSDGREALLRKYAAMQSELRELIAQPGEHIRDVKNLLRDIDFEVEGLLGEGRESAQPAPAAASAAQPAPAAISGPGLARPESKAGAAASGQARGAFVRELELDGVSYRVSGEPDMDGMLCVRAHEKPAALPQGMFRTEGRVVNLDAYYFDIHVDNWVALCTPGMPMPPAPKLPAFAKGDKVMLTPETRAMCAAADLQVTGVSESGYAFCTARSNLKPLWPSGLHWTMGMYDRDSNAQTLSELSKQPMTHHFRVRAERLALR